MSGYLQRLVLGVMRPVESIHPLVGSVYSPVKYGDHGREDSNDGAVASEPDRKPSLEKISYSPERALSEWRREQQSEAEKTTPLPLSAFTATQNTPSLLPTNEEAAHRDEVPSLPIFIERQTPATASQPVPVPLLLPTSSSRAARLEHSIPTNSAVAPKQSRLSQFVSQPEPAAQERQLTLEPLYRPMVPADLPAARFADADKATGETIALPSPVAPDNKNGFPRPAAPVESNRDEIQIHIGRIEVTAWPPAPIRPAPPSPRKGLNLEEYLKGSDRRWR